MFYNYGMLLFMENNYKYDGKCEIVCLEMKNEFCKVMFFKICLKIV